ncbi:GNAT family N-acetyltransferase [Lentzea sp. NPDC004782]|uniref:GNAT family N-acetyltransferase n=1 Tax=Lentzea sp. NPDC004782 TaxID=3154458 RepID=UPI0033ADFB57
MNEALIEIIAVPGGPSVSRWQAMAPRGFVAGMATLRPIIPFGVDFLLPAAPALKPGAAGLGLHVEPGWRRRGIGSRLLAAVLARAVGRSLLTDVTAGSPWEAFCRRYGFRHTGSRRHDLLTYCDVHEAWLGELVDTAHPGYRLVHWSGDLSDVFQVETLLRSPSRPGNALLTVAEADGDLAAYAMAVVCAPPRPRARQYGPAVSPGHRGRRLGHWVNAALIQRLREAHPHVNEIQTHTAEDDHDLLVTREDLGYHPVRRTHLYELALS